MTTGWNSAASRRERTNWASTGLKARKTVISSIALRCQGLFQIGEDDDTGAGLEQALNLHFGLMANGALGIIDHDHRSIREIANTLALVFAFTNDAQGEHFAWQQNH